MTSSTPTLRDVAAEAGADLGPGRGVDPGAADDLRADRLTEV